MRAELPVLSYILVVVLSIILPLNLRRTGVANLTIVSWLLVCNLVQGINSVVWANNVAVQIPAWCDIVTKVLLATNVAIPAAIICLLREMEQLSSTRIILDNPALKRNKKLFETSMCIFLPILYICLHFFVQNRRFEIVQDLGCQASIYPSVIALILIWLPPLFLCIIAFVYLGIALYNVLRQRPSFSQHLASKANSSTPTSFIGDLTSSAVNISILTLLFIYSISAQVSPSTFDPSPSWSTIHAKFSEIAIVSKLGVSDVENVRIQFTWWTIPVLSIVYTVFFVGGEISQGHARTGWMWIRKTVFRQGHSGSVLPEHAKSPAAVNTADVQPIHLLPSFWDDSSDAKLHRQSERTPPRRKSSPKLKHDEYSPPSSPELDQSFKDATLAYVQSPVGRQALDIDAPRAPPRDMPSTPDIRDSNLTGTSSILHASWPKPPASIPTTSPTSSTYSTNGHVFSPSPSANSFGRTVQPNATSPPFQGSGIPTTPPPTPPPKSILKPVKRHSSTGSLRRTLSSREGIYGFRPEDVIYMTVVSEITP